MTKKGIKSWTSHESSLITKTLLNKWYDARWDLTNRLGTAHKDQPHHKYHNRKTCKNYPRKGYGGVWYLLNRLNVSMFAVLLLCPPARLKAKEPIKIIKQMTLWNRTISRVVIYKNLFHSQGFHLLQRAYLCSKNRSSSIKRNASHTHNYTSSVKI